MNQSVATAARRHLIELESRVAHQRALVERLESENRNSADATRTLRILQNALAVTKEHLRFILKEDAELCPAAGLAAV
jgi:hypothetical protein